MLWWILIADAARARLFSTRGFRRPLYLVREIEHPQGRAKPQDLVSDDPGKYSRTGRGGMPSTWAPSTPPHVVEEQRFAHELAEILQTGLARRAYDSAAIIAPPKLLGFLRLSIGPQVHQHLARTMAKDLTVVRDRELSEQIATLFRPV
jgi:protein required for attachment to host cells